jgi:hypothetical protein
LSQSFPHVLAYPTISGKKWKMHDSKIDSISISPCGEPMGQYCVVWNLSISRASEKRVYHQRHRCIAVAIPQYESILTCNLSIIELQGEWLIGVNYDVFQEEFV